MNIEQKNMDESQNITKARHDSIKTLESTNSFTVTEGTQWEGMGKRSHKGAQVKLFEVINMFIILTELTVFHQCIHMSKLNKL